MKDIWTEKMTKVREKTPFVLAIAKITPSPSEHNLDNFSLKFFPKIKNV